MTVLTRWMVLVALPTGLLAGCGDTPATFEQCIQRLTAGTPDPQIRRSLDQLNAAGMDAFPALFSHFDDTTPAVRCFPKAIIRRLPDGSIEGHAPTIGEVCFDIVQYQIEGNWPKGYVEYYVLTPETVQSWLDSHRGMTLEQLRIAAAEESLRRAEADDARDIDMSFLLKNLDESKRGSKWNGESE